MLKISNRPSNATQDSGMHLSAVSNDDDDELIQSINSTADDTITLSDPDVEAIDNFWSGVQKDLKNDPSWFNFAED